MAARICLHPLFTLLALPALQGCAARAHYLQYFRCPRFETWLPASAELMIYSMLAARALRHEAWVTHVVEIVVYKRVWAPPSSTVDCHCKLQVFL